MGKDNQAVFEGFHNSQLQKSIDRLSQSKSYKDLSTIWVTPTRGSISAKVIFDSWLNIMMPMNQKFIRIRVEGVEVGEAYNRAVEMILNNPDLSKWKYMLTVEEDNMPPTDGILKLYENMDKFDAIGGLYWTKGEAGQPMIYGDPKVFPKAFTPQRPIPDTVQECLGLGMGFTMFKIDMLKKIEKPWFKTVQEIIPNKGAQAFTQDLFFFEKAGRQGFKFASDNRVKVGHYDSITGMVW